MRVAFVALVVGVLCCDEQLLPETYFCEEAVQHLADCCPGLDAQAFSCPSPGCENFSVPDIGTDDGKCIAATDCPSLRASGACDRARAAAGRGYGPPRPDMKFLDGNVCP